MSVAGTFAGGSSGFGFNNYGYSSGGGQFGRFGSGFGTGFSDIVKSDYDQERLLQQLMLSETLHLRIKKGAAQIPDLLSPWTHPDNNKLPQV